MIIGEKIKMKYLETISKISMAFSRTCQCNRNCLGFRPLFFLRVSLSETRGTIPNDSIQHIQLLQTQNVKKHVKT